jgi:hypothetical protein
MLTAKFDVERTMTYYLRAARPQYSSYNSGFVSLISTLKLRQIVSSYDLDTEEFFNSDLLTTI